MSTVTEVNVESGEVAERPMTTAEQEQATKDRAAAAARDKAETDDRAARDKAEGDWRAAVARATTLDEVKAALLGTNLTVQADVRRKP